MKIYHLFPGNAHHLVPDMMRQFVERHLEMGTKLDDHRFVVYGDAEEERQIPYRDAGVSPQQLICLKPNPFALARFLRGIPRDAMLVLHGALHSGIWIALLARPTIWKRTAWIMWGDTSRYHVSPWQWTSPIAVLRQLRRMAYKRLRNTIVHRLGAVATLVPGDFDALQQYFGKLANYQRVFYSDHVLEDSTPMSSDDRAGGELRICVGNSATRSNNHIEALQWLGRFRNENIKIICPLNYGVADYRDVVIAAGQKQLGDKFQPLLDLLPREEYVQLLKTVDILIFNHRQQQGLFSLYSMLFHGKKCFVRSETSSYGMLRDFDIRVFPTETVSSMSFEDFSEPLPPEVAENNRLRCQKNLSRDASLQTWKQLFACFRTA